jgi:hypothetical protein
MLTLHTVGAGRTPSPAMAMPARRGRRDSTKVADPDTDVRRDPWPGRDPIALAQAARLP